MKNKNVFRLCLAAITLFSINPSKAQVTTFDYTGTIESYTVPAGVTSISIQAYGAQGGNDNGGLGAGMYGEFTVVPGQVLNIVVGQQGIVNNCGGPDASGGGGGGSFVWDPSDDALPWIAAGGGGGGNENWGGLVCREGIDGQATEDGTSGAEGMAAGGVGGMGGAGDAPSGTGSGGGGWLSAGQNSTFGTGCTGGTTLPTFLGGDGSTSFAPGGEGGFGGGGGAVCGCGGGGGFSGGAGGNGSSCRAGGGGGGSYNDGIDQVNESGVRSGHGQVIITALCVPLTVSVSAEEVCFGDTFTLDASGTGSISWDGGVTNGLPFTATTPGLTTYTTTSDNPIDCEFSIDIFVFDEIIVAYSTNDEIAGVDGSIDITVSGGTPGYTFDWDNDGTGDFDDTEDLAGLAGGTYVVVVQDEIGCTTSETIVVNSQLGIQDANISGIRVYPNPTQDMIMIKANDTFDYQVTTADGSIVFQGTATGEINVNLENYANGVYFVSVNMNGNKQLVQVVKN